MDKFDLKKIAEDAKKDVNKLGGIIKQNADKLEQAVKNTQSQVEKNVNKGINAARSKAEALSFNHRVSKLLYEKINNLESLSKMIANDSVKTTFSELIIIINEAVKSIDVSKEYILCLKASLDSIDEIKNAAAKSKDAFYLDYVTKACESVREAFNEVIEMVETQLQD